MDGVAELVGPVMAAIEVGADPARAELAWAEVSVIVSSSTPALGDAPPKRTSCRLSAS
jgi:hypothetical protein